MTILNFDRNRLPNVLSQVVELQAKLSLDPTQFAALLDTLPIAVLFSLDRECSSIDGNAAARVLLRALPGQNLSRTAGHSELPNFQVYAAGRLIPPDELPMQKAARTGRPVARSECEVRFPDGSSLFLEGHSVPVFDKDRNVCGSIGAFVDITELKRLETENRVLASKLETKIDLQDPQSEPSSVLALAPPRLRSFDKISIRSTLALIVAAAILPLVAAMMWALLTLTDLAEARQKADLLYAAKSISAGIDSELSKHVSLAEGLSRSPALMKDDLSDFRQEAVRILSQSSAAWIVISDGDGQQLLNTHVEAGTPLPRTLPQTLSYHQRALATRATVISDVVIGASSGVPQININVPVFRDGKGACILTISITAASLNRLLHPADTPANWLLGVMDNNGRYVARAPRSEELIGELASDAWRSTAGKEGVFEFMSREGATIINANHRMVQTGWTVGVAINKGEFELGSKNTFQLGLAATVLSLLLSVVLSAGLSRRVAAAILTFRDNSAALLAGADSASLQTPALPELRDAWRSLRKAVNARNDHERSLHKKTEQLETLLDSAPIGIAYFDRQHRYVVVNSELAEINGISLEDHIGQTIEKLLPRNAIMVGPILDRVFSGAEVIRDLEIEGETPQRPGVTRYWLCGFFPVRDQMARVDLVGVWVVEITERKRVEEQNRLLMREVNHRSKNLLTIVQSIARQTARTQDTTAFISRFSERLASLAANQDLLIRNEWAVIDIAELVATQLAPFAEFIGTQISYAGGKVPIAANASQALGLALHELATNSLKYGALSVADGRVDIGWRSEGADFTMQWIERNGPAVVPPTRRGFGSTVLQAMLKMAVRAEVSLDFAAGGLIWRMRCPVVNLTED